MPTQQDIERLKTSAQDLLKMKKEFHLIKSDIEEVADSAPDVWARATICRMPVLAAFGHAAASRAMVMIEQQPPANALYNKQLSAYGQYLDLTYKVDLAAGQEVVKELLQEPTLKAAAEYCKEQDVTLYNITRTNPELARKRGKFVFSHPPNTPIERTLTEPLWFNAKNDTMALMIISALHAYLRERELPDSSALANELYHNVTSLANLSRIPGQLFSHMYLGRELAQKAYRQIQQGKRPDVYVALWSNILKEYLESGDIPPITHELGQALLKDIPTIAEEEIPRRLGHCAAQFFLQPYEDPEALDANKTYASRYFQRHNITLVNNSFKVIDYQLLRAIEVAQLTIFSDPECRLALESLANHIRITSKN